MRSDHVRVIVAVLWLSLLAALVACAQQVTPPGNELIGGVNDPVEEAIPSLAFVPREDDYTEDHPDLPGVPLSFNTLVLVFEQGTTVGEAQALLDDIEAEIVGGIPGVNGEAEGILFLRVPTTGQQAMIDLLARLRADPLVKHAVQDGLLTTMLVPQPNGGSPVWTWQATPAGGNWGMERIRAPQLWNLNAAVAKTGRTTPTGVLDVGFANSHEDLVYDQNLTVGTQADHGTHVAGTIAASFDNGVGVDGVNPFADLVVNAPAFSGSGTSLNVRTSWGQQMNTGFFGLINTRNDVLVVNASLGYNWGPAGINQNTSAAVHDLVEEQGSIFALAELIHLLLGRDLPVFVVAAGNDSNDISDGVGGTVLMEARWASPFAYAGIELNMPNIIVVESVADSAASAGGATRSGFSNLGGDISAPGSSVLSTSWRSSVPTTFYETMSGTSMASPHVTGLISYLFSVDPTLVASEIVDLLDANAVAVAGGASPRIDAFATVMDIDRVQGGDAVLRMLLDIDDGTPDGNQRILIPPTTPTTDFVGEDADGDGGIGDGAVDMADFRRWRDWLLQVENAAGLTLDGSAGHPKKDVNGNGSVGSAAQENLYPRGDFNGDGQLSRAATRFVPGSGRRDRHRPRRAAGAVLRPELQRRPAARSDRLGRPRDLARRLPGAAGRGLGHLVDPRHRHQQPARVAQPHAGRRTPAGLHRRRGSQRLHGPDRSQGRRRRHPLQRRTGVPHDLGERRRVAGRLRRGALVHDHLVRADAGLARGAAVQPRGGALPRCGHGLRHRDVREERDGPGADLRSALHGRLR